MERLAEQTESVLKEVVGKEAMVGVSYYDEEGVGHVFRSEWAEEKYKSGQVDEIVEELRFEALGHEIHEAKQEEDLRATVRIYEELLDVAVPVTEAKGVAFALDADGEFSLREVVDAVSESLPETEPSTTSSEE